MPEYITKNSVEIVESLLANINYPYSPDHYSFSIWADEINFQMVYLHIKEHIVSVDVWHRYNKASLLGERMASIEINQLRKICSITAEVSEFNRMLPKDFVEYITRQIVASGAPVKMEGEKLAI